MYDPHSQVWTPLLSRHIEAKQSKDTNKQNSPSDIVSKTPGQNAMPPPHAATSSTSRTNKEHAQLHTQPPCPAKKKKEPTP
jgi:hypothetical protein